MAELTCRELVEVITGYLEGTMEPADRRRFQLHLDECPGCRNYLEQMRTTIRVTGMLRGESSSPSCQARPPRRVPRLEAGSSPAATRALKDMDRFEPREAAGHPPREPAVQADDAGLLSRLRGRDESAFAELVDRHAGPMLQTAIAFTGRRAVAEEVVQDTWLAVLRGLDRFEGRSTLRTWIFRILVNRAKTQALRDRQVVPHPPPGTAGRGEPAVPPERFLPADHGRWPGHWSSPPGSWAGHPEERLLAAESMAMVRETVEALPALQRAVITLRDVRGWSAKEVCGSLGLTRANQRVLLHRARSRVRARLEQHLGTQACG